MSYQIIGDSCTDLTKVQRQEENIILVPLTLEVGKDTFVDDETFNQADFLHKMKNYPECPKSACPTPEAYMQHFDKADDIYVVTLSANLSGSYNSAFVAKNMYLEEHPDKNIEIVDSKSAACGQMLIAMKLKELAESGMKFAEVVEEISRYRDEMQTKFVLESLDNLRKNGRLTNVQAILASALNIKPIMCATPEGRIDKIAQARGITKALAKMIDYIVEDAVDAKNRILAIAHCNNRERAEYVKELIEKRIQFKDIWITETAGVSSLYANDGGIIVCY